MASAARAVLWRPWPPTSWTLGLATLGKRQECPESGSFSWGGVGGVLDCSFCLTTWPKTLLRSRRARSHSWPKQGGALGGIRTHGLSLRRAALYPLSYKRPCRGGDLNSHGRSPLRPERSASAIPPPRPTKFYPLHHPQVNVVYSPTACETGGPPLGGAL